MLDAIATNAWRRPWASLGASVALLAVLALAASTVRDQLGHPAGDGKGGEDLLVVTTAGPGVSNGVYDVTLDTITAGLEANQSVGGVEMLDRPGNDGKAILSVDASSAGAAEQRRLATSVEAEIDPGPLKVAVDGRVAELVAAEESVLDDLWRLELLVVPLAALLLLAVLGARLAAGPPLCAALAVAGALAGLAACGAFAELSELAIVAAAGAGLALGLELPATLAARWEDEIQLGSPREALGDVLREGTGVLLLAAAAAIAGAAGILALSAYGAFAPAASLVLGAALGAVLAVVACLLVMPPLLALDGRRKRMRAGRQPRREQLLPPALAALPRTLARGNVRTGLALVVALGVATAMACPGLDAQSAQLAAPAGDDLVGELPLAAAISTALVAAVLVAGGGSFRAAPLALAPVIPAGAALGALTFIFADSTAVFGLSVDNPRVLTSGALAAGLCVLVAIGAARTAAAVVAVRSERELDPGPPGVAERAAELTLPGSLLSTLLVGIAFAVLAVSALPGAQELGTGIAIGLVADLLLVRGPSLAALARWAGAADPAWSPRRALRVGWPRWRRSRAQGSTASPS